MDIDDFFEKLSGCPKEHRQAVVSEGLQAGIGTETVTEMLDYLEMIDGARGAGSNNEVEKLGLTD